MGVGGGMEEEGESLNHSERACSVLRSCEVNFNSNQSKTLGRMGVVLALISFLSSSPLKEGV